MKRYDALAFQDRTWWMIEIPELSIMTQARSRSAVPSQVLDLVATWFNKPKAHVPPPHLRWSKPRHFDDTPQAQPPMVNDYEELARRAEQGELTVRTGTARRQAEATRHAHRLLMDATGAATIDGAVSAAQSAS